MAYRLDGSALPIPEALTAALDGEWSRFGRAGTWWSAAERIAIVSEARAARACALCAERKTALSPYAVPGAHPANPALAPEVVDAVHRIVTDPGRLSSKWYQELLASGLEPEQVVEIAGLIGILRIGDTLAHACGSEPSPLPTPAPGEPSRERSDGLLLRGAWVPMVDPEQAQGAVRMMYDMVQQAAGFVFHVARALTAVPAELMGFFGVFLPNYSTHGDPEPGGLSRPQMELLASSTSYANDCFY
ncbi:MAG: alkylhydroperoxidase-related (seleno)protein [Myxococcota bacterium]|nr:alkylhydroperoxidase-related (seleno)protein [Myxococcota bacterium]